MGIIANYFNQALILAGPVLIAVTVHELAHGYVAYRFGDPTAKMAGRLTLNPLKHLDLLGTLTFFVTQMIGWAKPVPIDFRYFKKPKTDMIWVSLAGPVSNLLMAFIFAQLVKFIPYISVSSADTTMFALVKMVYTLSSLSVVINVGLAVFNLLPIPPLDGSHVLEGLLSPRLALKYNQIAPYGIFILLGLIFFGITGKIISPIIKAIVRMMI